MVERFEPDLVVSAGFMKLVSTDFLARFLTLNTHPALCPAFPGMHGPRDALDHGVKVSGATLFVVDGGVDTGPIVAQVAVEVAEDDDVESLHERIKTAERAMLVDAVGRIARGGITRRGPPGSHRRGGSVGCSHTTGAGGQPPGSDARGASNAWVPSTPHASEESRVRPEADHRIPIRRALVSVYDKAGLDDLVRGLHEAGVELVSTGGSAALIESLGLPVTKVEDLTGFPECLDGRVKTLHPRVHAGILADRRLESHVEQLRELEVEPFDLVVSNLYPFTATVASGAGPDECVEQIDIGGPSMVRAAAKNHPSVAIVTSPAAYDAVLAAVAAGGFTLAERQRLAAEAFVHTATYDVHVASWMGNVLTDTSEGSGFPAWMGATWTKEAVLRYGENPHQGAALYTNGFLPGGPGLAQATQHHGKEMSYNNYVDADAARRAAYDFDEPAVAIIKHANPCGIAVGDDVGVGAPQRPRVRPGLGLRRGHRDQRAGLGRDGDAGRGDLHRGDRGAGLRDGAVEALQAKKNIRILECPPLARGGGEIRAISGGLLLQDRDVIDADGDDPSTWTLATGEAASPEVLADLAFAWRACRAVKSNAILLASDGASVGVGMGQVNRVDSCRLAVERAGERAASAVAASDAFFPFADGPQILIDAGVQGDRAARRVGARRRGGRGLRGGRRDDVPHRHAALLPLMPATPLRE